MRKNNEDVFTTYFFRGHDEIVQLIDKLPGITDLGINSTEIKSNFMSKPTGAPAIETTTFSHSIAHSE